MSRNQGIVVGRSVQAFKYAALLQHLCLAYNTLPAKFMGLKL